MDATGFLHTLFGSAIGPNSMVSVWTLPDRATRFFDEVEPAASYVVTRAADAEGVYFGVGLYRAGVASGRGKAADVVCIPAMWADIDYGPVHSKKNIPQTQSEAEAILAAVGLKPSLVVHSGHGLHAYWLLDEALHASSGASDLASRWSATVRAVARGRGFETDSVGDLARVLRVPGTWNHKAGGRRPVEVISPASDAELRYSAEQIESMCVAAEFCVSIEDAPVEALILDPKAEPPATKLLAHMENDRRFAKTWRHQRPDLADQSASSYDMALASYAVNAGWTDQDIANLLIAFRRTHKLDLAKALRRDYLQRTIARAKATVSDSESCREAREAKAKAKQAERKAEREHFEAVDKILEAPEPELDRISRMIGVPVARWIQHGIEESDYSLVLANGRDICIGPVDAVMNMVRFKARMYEATGIVVPRMKCEQWDTFCRLLAKCVEVVANDESGRVNRLKDWLTAYLTQTAIYRDDEWPSALKRFHPFIREGRLHVSIQDTLRFIRYSLDEKADKADLWRVLRAGGFEQVCVSARIDGVVITRRYWAGEAAAFVEAKA
jgi:hypothetical protein